jgi:hypothetical protein
LTANGYAQIQHGQLAGGSGQEIQVNNILLEFDFGGSVPGLGLRFGEYGGNLNLRINGEFKNFLDFVDLNGATIGGVSGWVVSAVGNVRNGVGFIGTIDDFAIGGQELWMIIFANYGHYRRSSDCKDPRGSDYHEDLCCRALVRNGQ